MKGKWLKDLDYGGWDYLCKISSYCEKIVAWLDEIDFYP